MEFILLPVPVPLLAVTIALPKETTTMMTVIMKTVSSHAFYSSLPGKFLSYNKIIHTHRIISMILVHPYPTHPSWNVDDDKKLHNKQRQCFNENNNKNTPTLNNNNNRKAITITRTLDSKRRKSHHGPFDCPIF